MDVLQQLGLSGQISGSSAPSDMRSVPNGVILSKAGVILTPRARIQAPLHAVIPATYTHTNLSLVLSLSVHRVNSAFLFSALSKKKRVQLGVQFAPGQILVHAGQRSPVRFDYDVHDGQWHNLALDIQGHQVLLYTSCGKNSVHADLRAKKEEAFSANGTFLLGKANHHAVSFEGAICQFDIYPSAKAAQNYCDYIKKHCREADTYRPAFPALLPLFSTESNITVAPPSSAPMKGIFKSNEKPTLGRTTLPVPDYSLLMLNKTAAHHTVIAPKPSAASVSPAADPELERPFMFLTKTVTSSFRINMSPPTQKPVLFKSAKENIRHKDVNVSVKSLDLSTFVKPNHQVTAAFTQGSSSSAYLPHAEQTTMQTTMPSKLFQPKGTRMQDVGPTPLVTVTPAAMDDFQTFDLEPTRFSLLAGPTGLKGEPGPPVSVRHTCPLIPVPVFVTMKAPFSAHLHILLVSQVPCRIPN